MSLVLSYSRKDSQFADILYRLLESKGYDVWIDRRNIEVGSRWDQSIQNAIDARSHLAVILTPNSAESENVADEWSYALESGKSVIPIYYQDCNVPMRLRRLQRIDFNAGDFTENFTELLSTLGNPDRRPNDRIELARREGWVIIELTSADIRIGFIYAEYPQLDSFIRTVWYCLLWSVIPRTAQQDHFYQYGKRWLLKDKATHETYNLPENRRDLVLHEIGIEPNCELEIVLIDDN